jgi:ubiquinone/menaquinone biosynthesis C-methylase UbiE
MNTDLLLGSDTRVTSRHYSGDNLEVINLSGGQVEYDRHFFWRIFEATAGRLLAHHIEAKSKKIILGRLNQPEVFVEGNSVKASELLSDARKSFGSKRIRELFQLRTRLFNYSSSLLQHFCENVAYAGALDDVYNALGSFTWDGRRVFPESASPDFWSVFYLSSPNGQSVRNRYRLVSNIFQILGGGKTLSIACGSAQPLIHAIYELGLKGDVGSQILLTDVSERSLGLAKRRAEQAGVGSQISYCQVSFTDLSQFNGQQFDIVEACGILDYLLDDDAIKLLSFAIEAVKSGGHIIVSNMNSTSSAASLRRLYNWAIHYRTPEELGRLIDCAGGKNIKVYLEPWAIHLVAVATHES